MPRLLPPIAVLAALTAATLTTSACPEPPPCAAVNGETPFDIGHACGACAPTLDEALQCCTEHVGLPSDDLDATEQVVRCFAGAHGLPYPQYGEVMARPTDYDAIRVRPYGYAWLVWSLRADACRGGAPQTEGSMIRIHLWVPHQAQVSAYHNSEYGHCAPLVGDRTRE